MDSGWTAVWPVAAFFLGGLATQFEPAERQLRQRLREPEKCFADGCQALQELRVKAAAQQRTRPSDVSRSRALHRLASESSGLATITAAAAAPERLDRTA
ncbi:hypothetical protein ACFVZE_30540 [Streptomyces anulatus]|uniref:hypothetical protein n=1 Tax=Streptomyces TaxID=1883 RepID=UPI000BFC270D|nr:hypothetical protein [Streptomyces sp. or3]WTC68647.1 hypothetical protein OG865_39505 [Streptomyces anulatus]